MGVNIESKTFTVWTNRLQDCSVSCMKKEPWRDLQGASAGTATGPDVDASSPVALLVLILGRHRLVRIAIAQTEVPAADIAAHTINSRSS